MFNNTKGKVVLYVLIAGESDETVRGQSFWSAAEREKATFAVLWEYEYANRQAQMTFEHFTEWTQSVATLNEEGRLDFEGDTPVLWYTVEAPGTCDIHQLRAAYDEGVPYDEITAEQRASAKVSAFKDMYGPGEGHTRLGGFTDKATAALVQMPGVFGTVTGRLKSSDPAAQPRSGVLSRGELPDVDFSKIERRILDSSED